MRATAVNFAYVLAMHCMVLLRSLKIISTETKMMNGKVPNQQMRNTANLAVEEY